MHEQGQEKAKQAHHEKSVCRTEFLGQNEQLEGGNIYMKMSSPSTLAGTEVGSKEYLRKNHS